MQYPQGFHGKVYMIAKDEGEKESEDRNQNSGDSREEAVNSRQSFHAPPFPVQY